MFSFVTDAGITYNPRKIVAGPYGFISIFTGPKVCLQIVNNSTLEHVLY